MPHGRLSIWLSDGNASPCTPIRLPLLSDKPAAKVFTIRQNVSSLGGKYECALTFVQPLWFANETVSKILMNGNVKLWLNN